MSAARPRDGKPLIAGLNPGDIAQIADASPIGPQELGVAVAVKSPLAVAAGHANGYVRFFMLPPASEVWGQPSDLSVTQIDEFGEGIAMLQIMLGIHDSIEEANRKLASNDRSGINSGSTPIQDVSAWSLALVPQPKSANTGMFRAVCNHTRTQIGINPALSLPAVASVLPAGATRKPFFCPPLAKNTLLRLGFDQYQLWPLANNLTRPLAELYSALMVQGMVNALGVNGALGNHKVQDAPLYGS